MSDGSGADTLVDQATAATAATAEEPTGTAVRARRWWRKVPVLVWAVTGLHIALMAMCTFLYPPFTGYDETWHVDMTWSYYTGHGLYPPGGRPIDRGVEVAVSSVQVPPPKTPYADAPVPPRGERQAFDALDDGRPPAYPVPNQMVQHPPLYYLAGAGLLHLVPGGGDLPYDQVVWVLRLLSVVIMAPVPLLCWATARRLLGDRPSANLAAVIPVTMPGLSRLGGSVNNDNLLILLSSALLYLLARVVTGDLRKRTGALVGVVTTLALLTKGFALVLPLVVGAAYGVAWVRHRRRPLAPLGIAALLVGVLGSAWWVRNLLLYGVVQPSGLGDHWTRQIAGPERPGGTVAQFVPGFFRRLAVRVWGGFGLPDIPRLPEQVVDGWLLLVVVGALLAVVFGLGRHGRLASLVFWLPVVGILGIVFVGSLGAYLFNQRYAGVQGRYLYPGLVGLAVLTAAGWRRLAGRTARALPLVVLVAGLATQAYAWWLLFVGWWAPHSGAQGVTLFRQAFAGVRHWSPWPDGVTLVPFVLVPVLSLAAVVLALWAAVRRQPETASDSAAGDLPDRVAVS